MRTILNEQRSRIAWTLLLVSAATAHIVMPEWFVAYYPSYLPYPHQAVALSAIVELALAALLWVPRMRRVAWSCIALLMVAYVPVHVYVITHHATITHPVLTIPFWLALLRLPMQGVLVWWAWRMGRGWHLSQIQQHFSCRIALFLHSKLLIDDTTPSGE